MIALSDAGVRFVLIGGWAMALHGHGLFIKPRELMALCQAHGMRVSELHGLEPVVFSWSFWGMLLTRVVPGDFRFRFSKCTLLAYTGYAQRTQLLTSPTVAR